MCSWPSPLPPHLSNIWEVSFKHRGHSCSPILFVICWEKVEGDKGIFENIGDDLRDFKCFV